MQQNDKEINRKENEVIERGLGVGRNSPGPERSSGRGVRRGGGKGRRDGIGGGMGRVGGGKGGRRNS